MTTKMERYAHQAQRAAAEVSAWPTWMRVAAVPPGQAQEATRDEPQAQPSTGGTSDGGSQTRQ